MNERELILAKMPNIIKARKTVVGRTTPRHQANVSTDSPEDTDGWTYPDTRGVGKRYEANMLDFMSWFHGREEPYPLGTIFTRNELLLIKPVDIHDWLAVACFGIADYDKRNTGQRVVALILYCTRKRQ
jgi:hypothetical protein